MHVHPRSYELASPQTLVVKLTLPMPEAVTYDSVVKVLSKNLSCLFELLFMQETCQNEPKNLFTVISIDYIFTSKTGPLLSDKNCHNLA